MSVEPSKRRAGDLRVVQIDADEFGAAKVGAAQVGVLQVDAREARALKVGIAQIGTRKIDAHVRDVGEIGAVQIAPGERAAGAVCRQSAAHGYGHREREDDQ